MVSATELVEKLIDSKSKGRHCKFVMIGDVGLKVYFSQRMRDDCFKAQDHLSQFNLAPTAGDKVNIDKYFCYTTEVAFDMPIGSYIFTEWDEVDQDKFHEDMDEFNVRMRDTLNSYYSDNCEFNYGYVMRDGKKLLVLIDCDPDEILDLT